MGRVGDLETVATAVGEARSRGLKVALANGAFDLLHVGHIRYLKGAKALADVLVVALNSDASVRRLKGPARPAMPEDERAEIVAAIDGVDWVVIFGEETPRAVIERLRPDLQVKGRDYTPDSVPEGELVRSYGGRVVIAGDPKDHSTTSLLLRLREDRK
jgi:rfaE bifunctional protein nucleotidyltransferase chain/domain